MKRFAPLVVLVVMLVIAAVVVIGIVRAKQKHEAEMSEFDLCEQRFKEENYQEAGRLLDTFIQEHPKSEKAADAYYYLAMSREKLGDRAQAMTAWRKIIEDYPKSANLGEAYYYLGFGYQELGQHDEAMENYKTVLETFPGTPPEAGALYGMGVIYETKGQDSDAVDAYRSLVEKHPDAEFVVDAERGWGGINLKHFLEENATTYKIQRGDSLIRIAARFGITPEIIKRLNALSGNMLQPGEVIKVIKPEFNMLVDISSNRLSLMVGDKVIKKYPIASGKQETPTPLGDFKVTEKLPNPVWYSTTPSGAKEAIPAGDTRNELGTRWIGFKPAYGIHGTIDPDSIGKAMSKGCVRMHNQDVEELYDLVAVGVPVTIIDGAEKGIVHD